MIWNWRESHVIKLLFIGIGIYSLLALSISFGSLYSKELYLMNPNYNLVSQPMRNKNDQIKDG